MIYDPMYVIVAPAAAAVPQRQSDIRVTDLDKQFFTYRHEVQHEFASVGVDPKVTDADIGLTTTEEVFDHFTPD